MSLSNVLDSIPRFMPICFSISRTARALVGIRTIIAFIGPADPSRIIVGTLLIGVPMAQEYTTTLVTRCG